MMPERSPPSAPASEPADHPKRHPHAAIEALVSQTRAIAQVLDQVVLLTRRSGCARPARPAAPRKHRVAAAEAREGVRAWAAAAATPVMRWQARPQRGIDATFIEILYGGSLAELSCSRRRGASGLVRGRAGFRAL